MPLERGTKLAHYEVLDLIGKGGMGEVYRATDSKLGRDVAIKVLPEEFSQDEDRLARFKREAKVLASLNHPSIAAIYGLEESGGVHFLVLELVEGDTLEERIKRGPLPVEEALVLAGKLSGALEEAHEQGIVHRDLKPANVKLTPDDDIKVLDFGLAKAFAEDPTEADIASSMSPTITKAGTQLGVILGTAAYMSPEQAKGKRVDRRTDIFAFGSVLYELLTGRRAFDGDTVSEVIASVLAREPDMSRLPTRLNPRARELLARCLAKDPRKRWQAAGDLRVEIDTILQAPDREPAPISTGAGLGVRAHLMWAAVALAAAIAAATVAVRFSPVSEDSVRRFVLEPQPGQRLAENPLPGNDLALSPDGARLVYAGVESGVQQLFLRSMNAFTAVAIRGTDGGYSPFFSPDGQWLGYFVGSVLYKVQIPGGTPLRVQDVGLPTVAGGSWGPDDTILVGLRNLGLARVSASGGEVEIVARPDVDTPESGYLWPHFLPEGRSALFTIMYGSLLTNARLAVIRLDVGERTLLSDDEGYASRYVSSGHLVYGRAGIIMAAPFDLENLALSDAPTQVLDGVFTKQSGAQSISVSDDGTLAFIPGSETEQRRLVWVDRDGNVNPIAGAQRRNYDSPRLSPDRDQILVRATEGRDVNILIYDFERSTLTGLTVGATTITPPAWTPDGERVTFMALDGSVQSKPADGSGTAEIHLVNHGRGAVEAVAWLPDSSALALYDDVGFFLLRDGVQEEVFRQTKAMELAQSFSADGRYVTFISSESGRQEVYVATVPDMKLGRWQVSTNGGDEALFSRDGRELFYRSQDKMVAVGVELEPTFRVRQETELFSDGFLRSSSAPGYDYDARDQRFLMVQRPEEALVPRIHIVLDWFGELKRLVPVDD